jgi:hypothetical protein
MRSKRREEKDEIENKKTYSKRNLGDKRAGEKVTHGVVSLFFSLRRYE